MSLDVTAIVSRTRTLIESEVLPVDDKFDGDVEAAGGENLRLQLQSYARDLEILSPHGPIDCGGLGLNMVERAPVFEAAGRSVFGPMALNINAPDEGNMHLLDHVASSAQRERYLRPLVEGDLRSAFAMTEPNPGAGSDPSLLATTATRVDGGWSISGAKRFITGADGADFFIVMARTSGNSGDARGATMFLVPAGRDGLHVGRHVRTIDKSMLGGHCEMSFDRCFVPDDDVLGEVDAGFSNAQVRLGPARMTHVMRWLGAARRAHDVALRYTIDRPAFGGSLSDLGMVQQLIAENEIDLAATRALLLRACEELDEGQRANESTQIAKTFAGEALHRVVDRSMQMCGGLGVSDGLPIAKIAREIRPFRIYDGPSEVHRWSLAKRAIRRATAAAAGVVTE